MRAIAGFLIRLVAYAIVLGLIARARRDCLWVSNGLDDVDRRCNPCTTSASSRCWSSRRSSLALLGFGALRPVAVFVAAFLVGAALTAPFAFARLAGA